MMIDLLMIIDSSNSENFKQLTKHRVSGAIPFYGKYRLIDFALSCAKNSGITNVAIFPYGSYRSLSDHIGSGERWDLSRRKDGIFILPPKNPSPVQMEMLSFQRMYEHIEYFTRSSQNYVLVTNGTIVWNIDFTSALDSHIKSNADITEIIGSNDKRMKTFIIKKELLLEFVLKYDRIMYKNLLDIYDFSDNIKRNIYKYCKYSFYITNEYDLHQASMELLDLTRAREVFSLERPIYSKETMSMPTTYMTNAIEKNAIVASGAKIYGQIINSTIGRKVVIGENSVVKKSVIMNQTIIGNNCYIENAILDKQTIVLDNATILGGKNLFISEKGQKVYDDDTLIIYQIAVECNPFIKTGGLADIVGSLAYNLTSLGVNSRVIMPLYRSIKLHYIGVLHFEAELNIIFNKEEIRANVYSYLDKNTLFYFIDSYRYFDRKNIYGYDDDGERFAYFSLAAVEFLNLIEEKPNIIHIHDWHSGLIPSLIKNYQNLSQIKTLLTIHNIEYQGIFKREILDKLNLYLPEYTSPLINFLEIGLNTATKINTVSQTYKEELKYEYYSLNLCPIINKRERDFYGILNGLEKDYDPKFDLVIKERYDASNVLSAKMANKKYLQEISSLNVGSNYFVIGMVSRIVEQKGFDIIISAFDEIMKNENIEFVLLGTGEEIYMEKLRALEKAYPERVKMFLSYDATSPSYIYGGADLFLMPSRFEPCGIGQMIALKYGTIPLVRQTGGLNDTIQAFNISSQKGNGFKFYNYDYKELIHMTKIAYDLFLNHKDIWYQLILNAMKSEYSLEKTARGYIYLYKSMR